MIQHPEHPSQSHSPGCPDENAIGALVEGKLDPAAGARIAEHLDGCKRCQDLIAFAIRAAGSIAPDAGAAEQQVAERASGQEIGRYRVVDRIGTGAMGVVYRAIDPALDRQVALKVVRDQTAASRARLEQEARLAAKLAHPNVVAIYDAGAVDDDEVFVAMELVEGKTLAEWMREPHSLREVRDVFLQAARGLAAAHAAGLVHRDFKPQNVLVGNDGRVRVADFGLARRADDRAVAELAAGTPSQTEASATRPGAIIGSPRYMSPEQHRGLVADASSDQFAFCVALYEAVYGARPFRGDTLEQLAANVIAGRVVAPPRGARVRTWLRDTIQRGLGTDRAQRFASMDEVATALARGGARRWLRGAIAIAAAAGVLGFAAWQVQTHRKAAACRDAGADVRRILDDGEVAAVQRAFEKTGAPFAASSAQRATTVLQRYTGTLADAVEASCRADEPAALADARGKCLAGRTAALRAVVRSLETADAGKVQHAIEDAWNAVDRAPCRSDAVLLASVQTSRTLTPEQVEKLGEAQGLLEAGQANEAIAIAEPVLAAAKASGDPSAELAASLRLAPMYAFAGRTAAALPLVHRALALAETLGAQSEAAAAYSLLAGNLDPHADGATRRQYIELARAKLARSGIASGALEAKLSLIEEQLLRDDYKFAQAETAGKRAVELAAREFGDDHPMVGMAYGELGVTFRALGRGKDELEADHHAISVLESALGRDHPTVAGAQLNLAGALLEAGQLDESRKLLVRCDAVFAQALGVDHPARGRVLVLLADIDKQQQHFDAGRKEVEAALAIIDRTSGPESIDAGDARLSLAEMIAGAQHYDEAAREAERSVHILESALGHDHPHLLSSLLLLAELQLQLGRAADAIPTAERTLAILAGHPDNELAEPRMLLARALWDSHGDRTRARSLAEQARAAQGDLGGITREQIDGWLSEHPQPAR